MIPEAIPEGILNGSTTRIPNLMHTAVIAMTSNLMRYSLDGYVDYLWIHSWNPKRNRVGNLWEAFVRFIIGCI